MAEGRTSDGAQNGPQPADPINPRRPLYRRPRTWISAIVTIAVLAAAMYLWAPWRTVWVTDGSEVLANNLDHVQWLIHSENERVTASGQPSVSIALMLPIHPAEGEVNTPAWILHHIQGAYLAQYWSNHPSGGSEFGEKLPLIKLLLADTGPDGDNWQDSVAQLVDLANPEASEPLVAVAGLGQSAPATQQAVDELAKHDIFMVGSIISATTLIADGLVQVSPSNSDEAAAAIAYLRTTEEWKSASSTEPYKGYLVQDQAKTNTFADDLGKEYRQKFLHDDAHTLPDAQGKFDSSQPGVDIALGRMMPEICSIRPRVVLFAGRSPELRTFLRELAARYCSDPPITVVVGDSARNLTAPQQADEHPLWVDERANLEVLYTALASPQTWEKYAGNVSRATVVQFGKATEGQPCPSCFGTLFSDPLDDGNAIVSYDAVLIAVAAARNVASPRDWQPTAGALINGLYQITETNRVHGASGWIYFQRETGVSDAVPYNKAVPIMRLCPDGTAKLVALSRSGAPPVDPQPTCGSAASSGVTGDG